MSKRFIDTEIFDDPWFGELTNDQRIIWIYLCTKCDHAGIWKVNIRNLKFNCNTDMGIEEVKKFMNGRIVEIESGEKWFIPKFLKFQYPIGLNSDKPAIKSIKEKLQSYNLIEIINAAFGNDYLMVNKSLSNDYETVKDKDTDKDKDKEKVKDKDKEKEKNATIKKQAVAILEYLNQKTGRKFEDVSQITARLKEGCQFKDFFKIIDTKMHDPWFIENPKYYHPETIFRKCHWDKYLNEKIEDFKRPSRDTSIFSINHESESEGIGGIRQ